MWRTRLAAVGFCSIRSWLAAYRRRVVPLMDAISPFGDGPAEAERRKRAGTCGSPCNWTGQLSLYSSVHADYCFARLDVMNRLGRAMADPTRSRILMSLLDGPSHPAVLARAGADPLERVQPPDLPARLRDRGRRARGRQTRYEIADPHLAAALTALVDVTPPWTSAPHRPSLLGARLPRREQFGDAS